MQYPFHMRRATLDDKARVTAICHAIDPDDWVPHAYEHLIEGGLFVADQDGYVFGLYDASSYPNGDVYFSGMRIDPAHQGKGLGTLFCRLQVEQARAEGARHIYLMSYQNNPRAHRTVEKNGFENLGKFVVMEAENFDWPELVGSLPVRQATAADIAAAQRLVPKTPLAAVTAADMAYMVRTVDDSDWHEENLWVVDGPDGVIGVIEYRLKKDDLYVRRIHGTPEAAHSLLAHAVAEAKRAGKLHFWAGIPELDEHLLAPLLLQEEHAHRFYVFCLPAGKELPEAGIPVQVPEFS